MKKYLTFIAFFSLFSLTAGAINDRPLLKVFDAVYRLDPYKNVLFSPWGIQECFGMVYGGAGKISAAELEHTLGIDHLLAPELRRARECFNQSSADFNSFNAILFDRQYTLQKNFIDHAMLQYAGKLYRVDLARKKEAADMLNAMIKRESSGLFDQVFTEKTLSGDPAMVLLNVLFFKGAWDIPFEKFMTRPENFYTPSKNSFERIHHLQTPMMNDERFLPYYNDGTVHGIILDFKIDKFKMLVLTSVKQNTPLSTVTGLLAGKGVMHFVKESSEKNKTIIKLPRLKLAGELDLKKLFVPLGMKSIFDPLLGDLTGMVHGQTLYIDQAKQLVKLNLDEEGSEVAAVTYAIPMAECAPPMREKKNYFYADHPFVLVLFSEQTQAVLLTAAIVNPACK